MTEYGSDTTTTLARGVAHPNPVFDYLTAFLPRKLKTVFYWMEYLYSNSPQIFAALNKFALYPITDFTFETGNAKLKSRYKHTLEDKLHLKALLMRDGIDKFIYGNTFSSLYFPFHRYLKCPRCKRQWNITKIDYKFKIRKKEFQFTFMCKKCGQNVRGKVIDKHIKRADDINLIRWDPKQMDIIGNPITGESEYYYTIPDNLKDRVRKGDTYVINTMPLSFLETIARNEIFRFEKPREYHMRNPAPAGIDMRWGFPPLLPTLKQFFYVAILRKANEAIALEHIVPFRVLSPEQGTAASDPTVTISLSNWVNETKFNLKAWRKDPLHLMFSPIPVKVTNIGGQGRALMVTGEITEAENAIIAAMGMPREFIYGGLTATGSSVTLRMLENQLHNHTTDMIGEAQWVADNVGQYLGLEKIKIGLKPFKLVDDVQQKYMLLQANQASGGQMYSSTTLADLFGSDIAKERELRLQESVDEVKLQHDIQKKIQELQTSLADQARAAATVGATQSYDQQQIIGQADLLVQQLMGLDYGTRRSQLHALQTEDYVLYSVVIQRLEEAQTQAATAARQQAVAGFAAGGQVQ